MKYQKPKRSLLIFWLGSLFLHSLLVFIILKHTPKKTTLSEKPVTIEVLKVPSGQLKNQSHNQALNVAKGKSNSAKRFSVNLSKRNSKSYFGTSLGNLKESAEHSISAGDTFLADRKNDNPNAPWGQGAETFERIEDFTLFKAIYDRVDSSLSYPSVLSRHKIQGTVNTRFVLNQLGECDWKYTQIKGKEPYLQLYVLDLLKRVCDENFKRYVRDRVVTNVDISFQFAISENGDESYAKEHQALIGNTMAFYRNSHQSVLEWELGPFKGMFPVPAVYLNIPWIQENWERLYNGKDALKEFKKEFG